MYQDFNPLDLSAPKKPDPNKDDLKAPPVKVYRVSHGALLHSRITKILVTIMLIALVGIGSYSATYYYLTKNPLKIKNKETTISNSNTANQAEVKKTEDVYCGVVGMPKEVCEIITSIEKSGFSNNPNVTVDTTKLSKTAKFDISEQSWKKTDDKNGSITFDQNDNGKIVTGTVILTNKETGWTILDIQLKG